MLDSQGRCWGRTRVKKMIALLGALLLHLLTSPGAVGETVSTDAETVVRQLTERVYRVLLDECAPIREQPERLYALVDEVLLPHADLDKMTQWVLGKYWRQADDAQRRDFAQQFRQLLVRTYATAIQTVTPASIYYLPGRDTGRPDQALVRTEIRQPGEAAVAIDYLMYRKQGRWMVYDVRVEGVSLVTNYRTTFAEEIYAKGLPRVIASLKQQNQAPMAQETAQRIRDLQSRHCLADLP